MRALAPLLIALPFAAWAGTVRGTIFFPQETRANEQHPLANWRVENGLLPIAPATPEPRTDAIVLLIPERPATVPPSRQTLEAKGLRLAPRAVVGGVGSTFEFKNADPNARTLYLKEREHLMPRQPISPGQTRSIKIAEPGEYEVRDADYPHASATLLVVETPYVVRADAQGLFKIEVPDGKYTLKVFHHGAWAVPQAIDVRHVVDVSVRGLVAPESRR